MMSPELLKDLSEKVSRMIATVQQSYLALPDETLSRKEQPEAWTILQCFEHLNRYNRFYNLAIAERLRPGIQTIDQPVKSTWIGKKSIGAMHPSNKKRQKTLKHLNPLQGTYDRSVMVEFLQHQEELMRLLKDAERTDLNAVRIPVEFFRLLKMNLADAFQFVVVHQQRHFEQIDRILTRSSFKDEAYLKV